MEKTRCCVSPYPGRLRRISVRLLLDECRHDDDRVFSHAGATVVIDEISLDLIKGAEIDFVEDLVGSYFAVRNPNATSTCGCGTSFAV